MPELVHLEKAELRELDAELTEEIHPERNTRVQFNPETLKVSFANQVAQGDGAGDQKGTPARQFVGAGTTKLALQLWFDVSAPLPQGEPAVDDVRKLTQKVAYFITPRPDEKDKKKLVPPAVRFLWGTFQFDGILESMEESLEFFSSDGRPLRASVTLALTQQKITEFTFRRHDVEAPPGATAPGTQTLTAAPQNTSLQAMADRDGQKDWRKVATANRIENPRRLEPGRLIDMNPSSAAPRRA
jgi:hypothetical protein